MFIDVVDSVQHIDMGGWGAVQRIKALLAEATLHAVIPNNGTVIERQGDGLLLRFPTTRDAVLCASRMHEMAVNESSASPDVRPIEFRAGIHKGEVLSDGTALYGKAVNVAARIKDVGVPRSTLMSSDCRDDLNPELDVPLEDLGNCELKNLRGLFRLFRVLDHRTNPPEELEAAISSRMSVKPTLLILPPGPRNQSDATNGGLSNVIADQLIAAFSHSPLLNVISLMSSIGLSERLLTKEELYQRSRANYLLLSSLRVASSSGDQNSQIVLDASLWHRGSNDAIWQGRFTGRLIEALSYQSDMLGRLIEEAGQRIVRIEQHLAGSLHSLPNLASHTLYLNAVDKLHRFSVESFQASRQMLVALHERVPRHAHPLAWLARWHVFKVVQGWSSDAKHDGMLALDYSNRALDRDPRSALALTMAGAVHAGVRRDAAKAETLYEQALQIDPNDSLAWLMSGVARGFMNDAEPALAASETALGLAPVDPTRHYYDALSATTALRGGQYQRCIALAERAIRANGTHGTAYRSKAIAEVLLGRPQDATRTIQQLLGVEPHFTVALYRARVPEQDPRRDEFAEVLRAAGLPVQ